MDMLHIGKFQTRLSNGPSLLRLVDRSFPVGKILRLGLHRLKGFVVAVHLTTVRLDL